MIAALLLALPLTLVSPPDAPPQAPTASAEQQVRDADAARIRAVVSNDLEALAPMLADDLTYTHTSGVVDTKAEFLESLRSGRTKYKSIEPQDVAIRVYGDTAILTGRAAVKVVVGGEPRDVGLRFTSVYVRKDGRWQFAAWQSTRWPQ